ncbi:MAG: sugar MFS transporter [Prevotella sp.]|nr:sugar MFS transporter [Prevotella sp.]
MNSNQPKLTDRRYVVPFVLITTLFFLWGFARAILDVLNKHFQDELHISIAQSAWIQVTTYLGYFLMAIPAGLFINRYGYRRGVVLGLLLFGAGALAFIPASSWGTFHAFLGALFVIGCGLTFLETAANPYVTELGSRETSSSRLNLSQTFNGMGCFLATLIVGQFLFSSDGTGGDVAVPYTVIGVVVVLIALVFSRVDLPEIAHDDDNGQAGGLGKLFTHPMFVFGLLALLAYEVAEISINSYFVNFVTGQNLMDKLSASRVISLALVIFMAGRFIGSWVMRTVRAEVMLLWCAVGTVACMLVVLLDLGTVSLVALILNYLFEAIMFPTIFSLAVRGLGSLTKTAGSVLMMTPVGGCGFLLMGYVADRTNLVLPFVIPLLGFAVVLCYAARLVRNKQEEGGE